MPVCAEVERLKDPTEGKLMAKSLEKTRKKLPAMIVANLNQIFQSLVQRESDETLAELLFHERLALQEPGVLLRQRGQAVVLRLVEKLLQVRSLVSS